MTQETLLQIGKLGLAIEDGANRVLDMYRVKEELTGEDLFKGEPSEDRSHYAGYTKLYKLPGMKDIAVSLPYRPLEDSERRFVSLVRCAVATCLALGNSESNA